MSEEIENLIKKVINTIADMQKQFEKTFKEVWKTLPREYTSEYVVGFHEPLVDIEDRGDEYVIYADVPGFSKDEIKIKVTEDFVEIMAERSEEKKKEIASRNYVIRERLYEGFRRRITLPEKIRPEMAKARLDNGVLEIHLPKSGAVREIEVHVE